MKLLWQALGNFHLTRTGWWIGLGLGVIGLVLTFVMQERPADIRLELLSKVRVYDMHADVPGLTIMFNGTNIRERDETLTFYTLRISNPGGQPILQNMYDQFLPFGVEFTESGVRHMEIAMKTWGSPTAGEFIGPLKIFPAELVDASQEYLKKNASLKEVGGRLIEINKLVLDPGDYITFRVLVLHNTSLEPHVAMLGKIAGVRVREIEVAGVPEVVGQHGFSLSSPVAVYGLWIFAILVLISTVNVVMAVWRLRVLQRQRKAAIRAVNDCYTTGFFADIYEVSNVIYGSDRLFKLAVKVWVWQHGSDSAKAKDPDAYEILLDRPGAVKAMKKVPFEEFGRDSAHIFKSATPLDIQSHLWRAM